MSEAILFPVRGTADSCDSYESGISSCTSSISDSNTPARKKVAQNSTTFSGESDAVTRKSVSSNPVDEDSLDYTSSTENVFSLRRADHFAAFGASTNNTYSSFPCGVHRLGLRFYCKTCFRWICEECVLSEHITCNFEPFEDYADRLAGAVAEGDRVHFETMKQSVTMNRKSFAKKIEFIKKRIKKRIAQAHFELELNKKELYDKLDYVKKFKTESWNYQIGMCDEALNMLRNRPKLSSGSRLEEVLAFRQMLFATFGDCCDFVEDANVNFVDEPFPQFNAGSIETSPSPKHSILVRPARCRVDELNVCTVIVRDYLNGNAKRSDYRIDIDLIGVVDRNPIYLAVENQNNGTYKIKYYPVKKGRYLLSVYLDRVPINGSPCELLVTENEANRNYRTKRFGFGRQGDEELNRPWGICSDHEGRILVVDRGNHCVKIYRESGEFLTRIGKEGTGPGEFLRPCGIAVDKKLRRIIVADKDNHRIQVFGYDGSYAFRFGARGTEDGELCYPWDVSVNRNSQIAVSDSKNGRVQLFSESGKFVAKFRFGGNCPYTDLPRGLAFAPDDSLLVTDFNKHCVVSLDENFRNPRIMGGKGSEIGLFTRPQGIAVDDGDGKFAVADGKNNRIQVFQPDGEMLKVYRNFGKNAGELDTPQGISFLPDGRIVVTELGKDKAQVLDFL